MKASRTQTRGNCQVCGRDQAVNGTIAKHGYTVADGWFEGVCLGSAYAPMQQDRTHTDRIAATVLEEAKALTERAEKLEANEIDPDQVVTGRTYAFGKGLQDVYGPYDEGTEIQKNKARKNAIYAARSRARIGERFAKDILTLADSFFGTDLRTVTIFADKKEPIAFGERRVNKLGVVLEVIRTEGRRVYWKKEDGRKGWNSSTEWRKLPLA